VKDKNGAERLFTYYGPNPPAGGVEGKLFEVRIATLGTFSNVLLQRFTYDPDGNLKEQHDFIDPSNPGRSKITTFFYFPGGVNLQRTEETGLDVDGQAIPVRTRSFTYDALGRLESETLLRSESPAQPGPVPLTTTYHYDELDRVRRVVDPRESETHSDYDANGNLIETRFLAMQSTGTLAPPRLIEKRRYDDADRLVETEDFFGSISRFEYDGGGNLI
jgi:YD repeat-containing protein